MSDLILFAGLLYLATGIWFQPRARTGLLLLLIALTVVAGHAAPFHRKPIQSLAPVQVAKPAPLPVEMPLPTATPLPAPAAAVEETIPKADILKTLDHISVIVEHQKKELDEAKVTIDGLNTKLDGALASLKAARDGLAELKKAFEEMKVERDKAVEHDKKVTSLSEKFATVIGIQLALIVLLACLKFGVPSMSPPIGIIATCALPILALGVIKVLPHIP